MQWTSAPNIGEAHLPQRARGYWKTRFSAFHERVERLLEREHAQLPPWSVVGFGSGIAGWFTLGSPCKWLTLIAAAAVIAVAGFVFRGGRAERAIGWFALAVALGCALAWGRAEWVAAPRLARAEVVTFDSRVERIEPLIARGVVRLTLVPADPALPPRVRVSIAQDDVPPRIADGARVRMRARLVPPPPMPLPGAYDFARDAWFKGVGAVGKNLGPVQLLAPGSDRTLDHIRSRLGEHIRARLPGPAGGIATALATGDQHAVDKDDADAMRRAGLIYLIVVSGLHVAAVIGAAMFLTLKILALSERLALRFNLVLVSAGVGALVGIAYTVITGMQVPTLRSCIAALLVLAGIALGRDSISLRLLAVAAFVLLLIRPETLSGASFQLSFAAVAAIIALHSTQWARQHFARRDEGPFARAARAVLAMFATSLAVEITLVPLSLYHFHRAGLYGMGASLVALPLTTLVIMPLEGTALFLDLFGIGAPAWYLCGKAADLLLWISRSVGHASGAVTMLPSMPIWAFGAMVVGGIWVCLWNSGVRLLGLAPFAVGAAAAVLAPAPDLLVTDDGMHLAVVSADGRPAILRDRAGDFVQQLLAESAGYDGDPNFLSGAPFADCSNDACVAEVERGGHNWRILATRSSYSIDWAELTRACAEADIAVSDRRLPRGCTPKWLKLDRSMLRRTGGIAVYLGRYPRMETVADRVGEHPWAVAPLSAKRPRGSKEKYHFSKARTQVKTYLDFEKPIAELETRVAELKETANRSDDIDIGAEVGRLEGNANKLLRDTYAKLTAWQKTQVARHPERPHFKDYLAGIADDFVPLAGDRNFAEDPSIVGGLARIDGRKVMLLGHEKGDDTVSRLKHNFGMAKPEGYRKAIRLMKLADQFGIPVVSLVDTSGAFPGVQAEERGQAEAIARSTEQCLELRVPMIAAIVGEGGSGGAIAIAAANRVLMFEHAIYSVISPEGCASILWRTADKAPEAAEAMKITAADLRALGIIDSIVDEPLGGAHRDPSAAIGALKGALIEELDGCRNLGPDELKAQRRAKFLAIG